MYQTVLRDALGRFTGSLSGFHFDEEESYRDYKIDAEDVRFPKHDANRVYPVHTYNLKDIDS